MKIKLCSWVLIIALLMPSLSVIAEESFSIRNGITFGMSKNDVEIAEQQTEIAEWPDLFLDTLNHTAFEMAFGRIPLNTYSFPDLKYKDNIAGQDCIVFYRFDENDTLITMEYLSVNSTLSTNIVDALQTKYGTPHYNTSKIPFKTTSSMYLNAHKLQYTNTKQQSYVAWILPYSDTYVAIEAMVFSVTNVVYYEHITYTAISFDDYITVMNEMQKNINSDL
ncbi:MAG: hypothetical protein IJB69_05460 [Clostridia bacterium]|nr:hypothetical protein [Clostridia bacterium]